jgi:hypothetical protein
MGIVNDAPENFAVFSFWHLQRPLQSAVAPIEIWLRALSLRGCRFDRALPGHVEYVDGGTITVRAESAEVATGYEMLRLVGWHGGRMMGCSGRRRNLLCLSARKSCFAIAPEARRGIKVL